MKKYREYCPMCVKPLERKGDKLVCPSCGREYRPEDVDHIDVRYEKELRHERD